MRRNVKFIVVLVLATGPWATLALADGGQIRVSERHGDYRITVFTSPNPLRAGPVDVSTLIQDASTGEVVTDSGIIVELSPQDGKHSPIRAVATADAATNKLLRAALMQLPAPGRWEARVTATVPHTESPLRATFTLEAAPPLPPWRSLWPWFTWPIVVGLLFVAHRALVARRAIARRGIPSTERFALPIADHAPAFHRTPDRSAT